MKANVTSVMCSYNRVNGTYSCESSQVIQGLLKGELDFQGYVVSGMMKSFTQYTDPENDKFLDWTAQHTTAGSANAGMVHPHKYTRYLNEFA